MKRLLDKGFILTLIILAGVCALIGMVAGPLGSEALSIGASFSACLICILVVGFGLLRWKKHNR